MNVAELVNQLKPTIQGRADAVLQKSIAKMLSQDGSFISKSVIAEGITSLYVLAERRELDKGVSVAEGGDVKVVSLSEALEVSSQ